MTLTCAHPVSFLQVIVTSRVFDYEEPRDRSINIQVQGVETGLGAGGVQATLLSGVCNVSLEIFDENDNAPIFTTSRYSATVPENDGPRFLVNITATDADGTVANSAVRLALINASSLFSFDPVAMVHVTNFSSGGGATASLYALGSFDFESSRQHVLTVAAFDQPGLNGTATIVIDVTDVNDQPPRFQARFVNVTLSEASPIGQLVTTVVAVDADLAGTPAATVRYAIVSGDPSGDFALNRTSGAIVVRAGLDRERVANYTLNVSATDGSPPFFQDFATVFVSIADINDNNPVFAPHNATFHVLENQPSGVIVVNISATDADIGANGEIRYLITAGAGNPPMFAIDASTGVLSTAEPLDYETATEYNLTVTAYDGGTPARTASTAVTVLVINVNDNPPVFATLTYARTIERITSIGQVVVDRLDATDADGIASGFGVVSYYLFPSGSPHQDLFSINSSTGQIVTNGSVCNVRESSHVFLAPLLGVLNHIVSACMICVCPNKL